MTLVTTWDAAFERTCRDQVERLCATGVSAERDRAWQALLTAVAPHIERWAATSPALRRVGLTGEDEPRAVLVDVIERMSDRDFANLRAFLARQAPDADELAEAAMVEGLTRLAAPVTDAVVGPTGDEPSTPLRGWLLVLTRFVVKEHVKQRFGWRGVASWQARLEPTGRAIAAWRDQLVQALRAHAAVVTAALAADTLTVTYRPAQLRAADLERMIVDHAVDVRPLPARPGKRDVGSGAERLDAAPELGERPPLSTLLGVRHALTEIHAHIATFPPTMADALRRWLSDASFDAIAAALELPGPREAQALVRAAQARLRDRFRGAWPELFG
jgi:hypothetical protein